MHLASMHLEAQTGNKLFRARYNWMAGLLGFADMAFTFDERASRNVRDEQENGPVAFRGETTNS